MITIHNLLLLYLIEYYDDEALVKQILIKEGLSAFFTDYLQEQKTLNQGSRTNTESLVLLKELRYNKYKNELIQIKSLFDMHGVSFAVMKGIAVATELYGNQPYLRNFSDMDILVSPRQAPRALFLLKSIGYQPEIDGKEVSADIFLKSGNREHHFPALIKEENRMFPIVLEVHVDFVPGWIFNIRHFNAEEVLKRSYVNEFDIPVMDDYDAVLFMILHLVKHYVYQMVMEFAVGNANARIDLCSLHEIALFLHKKRNLLFNVEFEKRVCKYEARNELAFVCNILKEIYPPLDYILNIHFPEDRRACFSSRFSAIALTIFKVPEVLFGDKRAIVCRCIEELQKDAFILRCCARMDKSNLPYSRCQKVSIDGIHFYQDNRFGTYKDIMEMERMARQSGTFFVEWDQHYFWFTIEIKDENLSFPKYDESNDKPTVTYQDYIRLHFDTGKRGEGEAFVRGLVLKPQYMSNGSLHLVMREDYYLNAAETVIDKKTYLAEICRMDNFCTIQVGIPWNLLGYEPYVGFSFCFDVQMWDYNEELEDFVVLAWQNANKAWYDITAYGKVILTD